MMKHSHPDPRANWPARIARFVIRSLVATFQTFAVATTDCPSTETGSYAYGTFAPVKYEVMLPCAPANGKLAAFVFYFSPSDMDYFSGENLSEASSRLSDFNYFPYKIIAERLVRSGYSIVRYNALGVGCRPGEVGTTNNPYCIRSDETMRIRIDDFTRVLDGVLETAKVRVPDANRQNLILIGHSAASMVIANYIGERITAEADLKKTGYVGIAPALSSGREAIKYQQVHFWMERLSACAAKEFSNCSKEVLSTGLASGRIDKADKALMLKIAENGKSKALPAMKRTLINAYEKSMQAALKPTPQRRVTSIEYSNPVHFSMDTIHAIIYGDTEHAKNIAKLPAVSLVFGDSDIAISAKQEMATWKRFGGSAADGQTLKGLGHMLGKGGYWGPMEEQGLDAIVDAVDRVAGRLDAQASRKP